MDNTGKTDLLSSEEIDQILTAISSDDGGNEHDSERDQDSVRVRIVDFARLDAFKKKL